MKLVDTNFTRKVKDLCEGNCQTVLKNILKMNKWKKLCEFLAKLNNIKCYFPQN